MNLLIFLRKTLWTFDEGNEKSIHLKLKNPL